MTTFLRYFLPFYLLAYFGLAFCWRSYLVWRSTGVNPYRLSRTDSAHDCIGRWMRFVLALCVLAVALYSGWPPGYEFLTPLRWLHSPWLEMVGVVLLCVALVWTVVAQKQMGDAWRIGIDSEHRTQLVQQGVFQFSRNPIFLGMRGTLLGLFLILPNAVTLVALALGEALIQIQVRLEEAHLTMLHGESYAAYRRSVRRWL